MAEKEQKGFALSDVETYHCEGLQGHEDFDPDGNDMRRPGVGRHRCKIIAEETRFIPDHNCTWNKENYCLHQIWPLIEVTAGPDKGARIRDFLHIPTWDEKDNAYRPMAQGQENRWGNFMKSLGFPVDQSCLWPTGFRLPQIGNREFEVDIVAKMKDGQPVLRNGEPDVQVKMFGYHALGSAAPAASSRATANAPARTAPAAPTSPGSAAAPSTATATAERKKPLL